jgi:hypothetical protein
VKDEIRQALQEIATHPAMFGIFAALARWILGERAGGWRALFGYLSAALLVAWAGAFYLVDESLTASRKNFVLLLLCFVAKDVLTGLALIASQFRVDPWGMVKRLLESLRGGPKA